MAPKLELDNIRAIKVLGKGATGTVFLAHHTSSDPTARSPFALKVVDKSLLKTATRAQWELSLLSGLNAHPFLPYIMGSFEAHNLLGWAAPFCPGGDLNSLRYQQPDHVFSQSAIRFYLAEIVCALEYLHSLGIVYRDLKPENVLVQKSGHVTLTDFDLSKKLSSVTNSLLQRLGPDPDDETKKFMSKRSTQIKRIFGYGSDAKSAKVSPETHRKVSFSGGVRSNSFVGTPEYVSPEVVKGEGHAYGVDWWALGVLAYEMLHGKTPFRGKNRKDTFRNVLIKYPEFLGKRTALIDLIEMLLEKDPTKRLGNYRGAQDIKEHEFFKGMRWDLLTEIGRPPLIPSVDDGETEKIPTTFDIQEYFQKLRVPSSIQPSSVYSLSSSDIDDLF